MDSVLAIVSGVLVMTGIYCLLQRSLARLVIGIILLSQAANLIIFTSAGLNSRLPALITGDNKMMTGTYSDPLPQAIVLTAIVIGFGFTAFLLALLHRTFKDLGTEDIEELNNTDTDK